MNNQYLCNQICQWKAECDVNVVFHNSMTVQVIYVEQVATSLSLPDPDELIFPSELNFQGVY